MAQYTDYAAPAPEACAGCGGDLGVGGVVVSAIDRKYHTKCFRCASCNDQLATGAFEARPGGDPYCIECWNKEAKQTCTACGGVITSQVAEVNGNSYHPRCLRCSSCKTDLLGMAYSSPDGDGTLVCASCSAAPGGSKRSGSRRSNPAAAKCPNCNTAIGTKPYVKFQAKKWHADCFTCRSCGRNVENGFVTGPDRLPYCKACHEEKHVPACEACGKPATGKVLRAYGNLYHRDCFVCHKCNASLTSGARVNAAGDLCCAQHVNSS